MNDGVEVRRCRNGEIALVMNFIQRHWKADHVLAKNKELMDWQHGSHDGSHDYIIAIRGRNEIIGVLGYISSKRFDPTLATRNVVWLALWKIVDNVGITGVGIRMLNTLTQLESHVTLAVNGINTMHPPMYKALRFETGELKRFFVTSPRADFKLLKFPQGNMQSFMDKLPTPLIGSSRFKELNAEELYQLDESDFLINDPNPKSPAYFAERFLGHPFYNYHVYFIDGSSHGAALLAIRIAEHHGSKALRIVDFLGDPRALASIGEAISTLLLEADAEFADYWQIGLPDKYLRSAGFTLFESDSQMVLPSFFEPFESRNCKILYAVRTSKVGQPIICRADGDQDRPNILPLLTSMSNPA